MLKFIDNLTVAGAIGCGVALGVTIWWITDANAQAQRTTCYDSGNSRICDTFDSMGNITSKSRCYQSGNSTRCDTQSFGSSSSSSSSSSTTILPIPNTGRRP
jgi:hypothetical protein